MIACNLTTKEDERERGGVDACVASENTKITGTYLVILAVSNIHFPFPAYPLSAIVIPAL